MMEKLNIAFPFPPTARRLPLGRLITTTTALTPVTFVFTPSIEGWNWGGYVTHPMPPTWPSIVRGKPSVLRWF